jgi:hypothetical protein
MLIIPGVQTVTPPQCREPAPNRNSFNALLYTCTSTEAEQTAHARFDSPLADTLQRVPRGRK